MCKEAGGPMNSEAEHVTPAMSKGEKILDEQDRSTYEILAILNQEHFRDTFGEDGTASELPDDTPEFSQAFMDGMRAMMEERFGSDAAEQFMTLTNNQSKNIKNVHHLPKTVSQTEKAMSHAAASPDTADASLDADRSIKKRFRHFVHYMSVWPRQAAAVALIFLGILGISQTPAIAVKLPMVNFTPEITEEYSQVGTFKDIISTMDTTDYPKKIECVYVPSVMADGYGEIDRVIGNKYVEIFYENSEGKIYQYYQNTMDTFVFVDTEFENGIEIMIGKFPGFYVKRESKSTIWWFDYNYAYQLTGDFSKEDLITLAESLIELKE